MAPLPASDNDRFQPSGDLAALQSELAALRRELEWQQEQNEELRQQLRDTHESIGVLAYCFHGALPSVTGAVEIMADPERDEQARMLAHELARRQLDHLRRKLRELRDSFRLNHDLLTLDCSAVSVVPAVLAVLRPYRRTIAARGQQLEETVPEDTPVIWADPSRLAQILDHLLENAIRCTPTEGRISVHIEVLPGWVVIRLRDTGMGMSADLLACVSVQFAQRDPYPGGLPRGVGSSLSIVQGLMRLHGGTVEAHSEGRGLGSEFTLRFPLYEPASPAAPAP